MGRPRIGPRTKTLLHAFVEAYPGGLTIAQLAAVDSKPGQVRRNLVPRLITAGLVEWVPAIGADEAHYRLRVK